MKVHTILMPEQGDRVTVLVYAGTDAQFVAHDVEVVRVRGNIIPDERFTVRLADGAETECRTSDIYSWNTESRTRVDPGRACVCREPVVYSTFPHQCRNCGGNVEPSGRAA